MAGALAADNAGVMEAVGVGVTEARVDNLNRRISLGRYPRPRRLLTGGEMTPRPKKKYIPTADNKLIENLNYNQACDDWEKFLPTLEEIRDILDNHSKLIIGAEELAQALHERIRE